MIVGINLDPSLYGPNDFPTVINNCKEAGFTSARITCDLRRSVQHHKLFEDALRDAGILPLRVLCRESFSNSDWDNHKYRDQIATWRKALGDDADWEAGNEPDPGGGASSATMSPAKFAALMLDTRRALGESAFIVSGGLVGGNPDWVRQEPIWSSIRENCNAFGNHLYEMCPDGFTPPPFQERHLKYWIPAAVQVSRDLGLSLWITEIGAGHKFFSTPDREANFFLRSYAQLMPHAGSLYPFSYEGVDDYALCPGNVPTLSWNVASGLAQSQADKGGSPMKLEELAAKHGGVYGQIFTLQGVGVGTARVAFVNDKPGRYVLEINGEADGPYDRTEVNPQ